MMLDRSILWSGAALVHPRSFIVRLTQDLMEDLITVISQTLA
jgi:hypothetical protein